MSELITISGVRGYVDEKGTAQLGLEDCARGLGFTQDKNGIEYVRWGTVAEYLVGFGFSQQVGKETFIPENIFYRLAMKAKNETAEVFQAKVADEILPAIRRTGMYSVFQVPKTLPDALRLAATAIEEKEAAVKQLEAAKPKVEFYDAVAGSKDAIEIGEAAKVLNVPGVGRNKLFSILRIHKILMQGNQPYQEYVDRGYFRVIEQKYTKPNGDTCINIKTLVYQKGLDYIRKILTKSNVIQIPDKVS